MRLVLAIVLVLATSVARADVTDSDSDTPLLNDSPAEVVEVEDGRLDTTDGLHLMVGNGIYLNKAETIALAQSIDAEHKKMAELVQTNATLAKSNIPIVVLAIVAIAGFAGGALLVHFTK